MTGKNCGLCKKCVMTQLNFIVRSLSPGRAFPQTLLPADVLRIEQKNAGRPTLREEICEEADKAGLIDDRIEALRAVVCRERQRHGAKLTEPEIKASKDTYSLKQLEQRAKRAELRIVRIETSTSWWITRPLRFLHAQLWSKLCKKK
jgi:hypothetical protein